MTSTVETTSLLTCPECRHASMECMPTDACMYFFDCKGCGVLLRPQPGDCCVFCSYGTHKCPPMQLAAFDPKPTSGGCELSPAACSSRRLDDT